MKSITLDPSLSPILINPLLSKEQALNHASDMLRCVRAVTYECGENLSGHERQSVFAALHMIETISALVDHSLEA